MNRKEYLLGLLMEEASEVTTESLALSELSSMIASAFVELAKAANKTVQSTNKCIRFTTEHAHYAATNLERLKTEVTDFASVVHILNEEFGLGLSLAADPEKIKRIEKYMQISREMGTLNE